MKFNWGKGIVLMIASFLLVWVGLIIFAFNQKVDLVTPNYYEQELKYQQEIEKQRNTLALQSRLEFEFTGREINVHFPVSEVGVTVSGDIKLYRPSDSRMDKTVPVNPDTAGLQRISVAGLPRGLWKVKINWHTPAQKYYDENEIRID